MKKHIKNLIIVLLLVVLIVLFLHNQNLKTEILNIESIPVVELSNYLSIGEDDVVSGGIVGFVKFNNMKDQPKDLQQYVKITALNEFDSDGNQLFLYQDIIKMYYISPQFFDPVYIKTISKDNNRITLSDEDGNLFFINKNNREVGMFDSGSDNAILITKDTDFRKFIFNFYK